MPLVIPRLASAGTFGLVILRSFREIWAALNRAYLHMASDCRIPNHWIAWQNRNLLDSGA
jgi:hypothetical protein